MASEGTPEKCLGPESNRYGVAPEGFSYPLQLSLLRAQCARIWSLDFTFAISMPRWHRLRQGPSSLYTFPIHPHGRKAGRAAGLARYCSHRNVLLFHRI